MERGMWKDVFCITYLGFIIEVGHINFYITCLSTLFSLDELIFPHFASFSYVVHIVWELCIVFDYMILILNSHAFNCKD